MKIKKPIAMAYAAMRHYYLPKEWQFPQNSFLDLVCL
jgi:hypothetical protein